MAGTSLTTTDNFVDFETAHWGFWSPKCSKVKKTQANLIMSINGYLKRLDQLSDQHLNFPYNITA